MTFNPLKSGTLKAFAICSISAATLVLPASALADETGQKPVTAATDYQVKSSSNSLIKSGVKAFKKGDYAKSIGLNQAVIKIRASRMKTAIAQANLCASYAKLNEMKQAAVACDAALKLRPGLEVAQANKALLQKRAARK